MAHFNSFNSSNGKFFALAGAMALCMSTGTSAMAMGKAITGGNGDAALAMTVRISGTVDNSPTQQDPDGPCEECWVSPTGNSSGSEATIEMYFEDDGEDFAGDLEIDVALTGGGSDTLYIYDTEINDATSRTYYVAPGSSWNWNDVDSLVVTVIE